MSQKTYKACDKFLKCRDFQYEIGKTYETDKTPIRCTKNGFHSCENPLHVLRYYPPSTSRFLETEIDGEIDTSTEDTKRASQKISIKTEITLKSLLEIGFKLVFDKIKWGEKDKAQTHGDYSAAQTHGYYSAAQTHGYYSAAQTHGNSSAAQTHGNSSAAQTHGNSSIAVSTGINGKASGIIGNWLVLAEWGDELKCVKSVLVDGKRIKPNVFYKLENGKFIKAE